MEAKTKGPTPTLHSYMLRERETDETRLKSWLRRPRTSPQSRILGGAMGESRLTVGARVRERERERGERAAGLMLGDDRADVG